MTKPRQVLWACPNGHPSVRGPQRPRMNNIVRYCLECSKAKGVLVERHVPSLERRREQASAKSKQKAVNARQRQVQSAHDLMTAAGVYVPEVARKAWRLPSLKEQHQGACLPQFTLSRRTDKFTSGHAWGYSWHLSAGGEDAGPVIGTILHELTHCALMLGPRNNRRHDNLFWSVLVSAVREYFPGITGLALEGNKYEKQTTIDRAIDTWLKETAA